MTDAGTGTPEAGCLIVLNSYGVPVETWSGSLINGPWDLTSVQVPGFAELFVTNVLNGTVAAGGNVVDEGTVVRLDVVALPQNAAPQLLQTQVIATGFAEQLNSAALVLGPTGVALGRPGRSMSPTRSTTGSQRSRSLRSAPRRVGDGGLTVTPGGALNAPLGLMLAPDGDVIAANGGNGNAVEATPSGDQVANVQMDPLNSGGDLFGLTHQPNHKAILFVDDGNNTLERFGP